MTNLALTGLGLATPRFQVSQADACELSYGFSCDTEEQRRMMTAIYRRSGVRAKGSVVLQAESGGLLEREHFFAPRTSAEDHGPGTAERMRLYHAEALPLAAKAAGDALSEAECAPREITHLVTASCSGFTAPGVDIGLIQALQLPCGVSRTHLGFMGCHAGFNALRVASAFVAADPAAVVLVCAVELCSVHHYYGWDPEKVIANAIFADGAGAALCRGHAREGTAGLRVVRQASYVIDDTLDAMSWRIGDHGFAMTLSQEVPKLIERHLRPWLATFLDSAGVSIADVGSWALHPGGPRILDACRQALELHEDQLTNSRQILADHGNMSSATLFFLLNRLKRQDTPRPVVAVGFGPGLTVEAMLLR